MNSEWLTSKRIAWSLTVFFLLLLSVTPIIIPVVGHDSTVHLNWLYQFPKLFQEGHYYPRWMPDSNWGFGAPSFYFYSPLVYWIASIISLPCFTSEVELYHILALLFTLLSGVTGYFYLRTIATTSLGAYVGAIIYIGAPYRFVDTYIRNALTEHFTFIILPLLFLSVEVALKSSTRSLRREFGIATLSACLWAALIFANLPITVLSMYALPIYALFRVRSKVDLRAFIPLVVGAMIGGLIASIYLYPIYELVSSIQIHNLLAFGKVKSSVGFILIDYFNEQQPAAHNTLYVALFSMIALAGWSVFILKRKSDVSSYHAVLKRTWLVLMIASIALQVPYLTSPVWEWMPLMKLIQFTWRWDMIIVLGCSACIALTDTHKSRLFVVATSLITVSVFCSYAILTRNADSYIVGSHGRVDAHEYVPSTVGDDFKTEIEALRLASKNEYITSNDSSYSKRIRLVTDDPYYKKISFPKSEHPIVVTINTLIFPTWKMRDYNSAVVPIFSDSIGRITATIDPQSDSYYTLTLEKHESEKTGQVISLIGVGLLAIVALLRVFWRSRSAS